jgi:hypothetical protein
MKRTLRVSFACMALAAIALVALPRAASTQSLLTLQATAEGNVVTVTVTIQDDGGATDCGSFHLVRRTIIYSEPAVETRCIPREIGTTKTHQFIDTLPPNRAFEYEVRGMSCFAPCVCISECDQQVFSWAFGNDWGTGFRVYVDTGPETSTPIAHGVITEGYGNPVYLINGCPGAETWGAYSQLYPLPYVGTGIEVLAYGSGIWDVQNGPVVWIVGVVPWACEKPVAAETRSWGGVKSIYR